jgi:hypothetical protein
VCLRTDAKWSVALWYIRDSWMRKRLFGMT